MHMQFVHTSPSKTNNFLLNMLHIVHTNTFRSEYAQTVQNMAHTTRCRPEYMRTINSFHHTRTCVLFLVFYKASESRASVASKMQRHAGYTSLTGCPCRWLPHPTTADLQSSWFLFDEIVCLRSLCIRVYHMYSFVCVYVYECVRCVCAHARHTSSKQNLVKHMHVCGFMHWTCLHNIKTSNTWHHTFLKLYPFTCSL